MRGSIDDKRVRITAWGNKAKPSVQPPTISIPRSLTLRYKNLFSSSGGHGISTDAEDRSMVKVPGGWMNVASMAVTESGAVSLSTEELEGRIKVHSYRCSKFKIEYSIHQFVEFDRKM